jgi:acetoin utilization deacetylase AcuC-like enzyme
MKLVFEPKFLDCYCSDPAASSRRLDHALELMEKHYSFSGALPAQNTDILLVHNDRHLNRVRMNRQVYEMALLSAGAAIQAAEFAVKGEPAFALCRPPGHHASPDGFWGFCYFNNISIAIERLLQRRAIESAMIVDFDLHFGDGTNDHFESRTDVSYYHGNGHNGKNFIENLKNHLDYSDGELLAVSAGFDRHCDDWGRMLSTKDYGEIGRLLGDFAREKCEGRIFAVLEGGYNPLSLGEGLLAFLQGLEKTL